MAFRDAAYCETCSLGLASLCLLHLICLQICIMRLGLDCQVVAVAGAVEAVAADWESGAADLGVVPGVEGR